MKKLLALLLTLLFIAALTTGCTKKSVSGTEDDHEEEKEVSIIHIKSNLYGDIRMPTPDEEKYKTSIAGNGDTETLNVLSNMLFDEYYVGYPSGVQYQKIHIEGKGFHIVIGYTDFRESCYRTYGMYQNSRWDTPEAKCGGLKGWSEENYVFMMVFPATTQFGARVIAIYPDELAENEDPDTKSTNLAKSADVQAILNTIEFSGDMKKEDRFEDQPVRDKYFTITPNNGWETSYYDDSFNDYVFIKPGIGNGFLGTSYGKLEICRWSLSSAQEEIDDICSQDFYAEAVRLDNIEVNGRVFLVAHDPGWSLFFLATPFTDPDDFNSDGCFLITISYLDRLEPAMSLINTIYFN